MELGYINSQKKQRKKITMSRPQRVNNKISERKSSKITEIWISKLSNMKTKGITAKIAWDGDKDTSSVRRPHSEEWGVREIPCGHGCPKERNARKCTGC